MCLPAIDAFPLLSPIFLIRKYPVFSAHNCACNLCRFSIPYFVYDLWYSASSTKLKTVSVETVSLFIIFFFESTVVSIS